MAKPQDILLNTARLRSACSQLSIKQLTRIGSNIDTFIAEKEQQMAQAAAAESHLQEKKQKIMAALSEEGLTLNDLIGQTSKRASASKPVSMQYRIKDNAGQVHEWSGRGRAPKTFADFFAGGGTKEACKIN